jgi:hypothetical protein
MTASPARPGGLCPGGASQEAGLVLQVPTLEDLDCQLQTRANLEAQTLPRVILCGDLRRRAGKEGGGLNVDCACHGWSPFGRSLSSIALSFA